MNRIMSKFPVYPSIKVLVAWFYLCQKFCAGMQIPLLSYYSFPVSFPFHSFRPFPALSHLFFDSNKVVEYRVTHDHVHLILSHLYLFVSCSVSRHHPQAGFQHPRGRRSWGRGRPQGQSTHKTAGACRQGAALLLLPSLSPSHSN